ncbi:hypothetical protein B0T18DRAFT_174738 [Schizothecium vesticola]|uniref:Uncharacterized protein n=1 Tax=Schizothecium vesticola TaxID=314040 RepID=A0AA40K206_9PEZI|nr:hypothetical protein B0T18DRAFT_174738 [Schizothecium vesticola]
MMQEGIVWIPTWDKGESSTLPFFRPDLGSWNGLAALLRNVDARWDAIVRLSCAWLPRRVNVVVADQPPSHPPPHPLPLCIGPLDIIHRRDFGRGEDPFSFCPSFLARVLVVLDLAVSCSSSSTASPAWGKIWIFDAPTQWHQTVCQILKNKTVFVLPSFALKGRGTNGTRRPTPPGNWPAGGRGAGQVWSHASSPLRSSVRNSTAIGSRNALADPCWWDALEAARREERLRGRGGGRECREERAEKPRRSCVSAERNPLFSPRPPLPLFRHNAAPSHGSLMVTRESCKLETIMFPLAFMPVVAAMAPFSGQGGDQPVSRDARCKCSFFLRVDEDDGRVVSSDDRQQTKKQCVCRL